ncbi:hypothetical protein LY78DRAFT_664656 [Colletotrichum sublineola]|nr:hypothetical protein LY78DRAFT_664656 [Colletotrichum sublineola]
MLDRPAIFDVKHAIVLGDSFRDFFPDSLKARFANDTREWASKVNPPNRKQAIALFINKISSIIRGWSPDLIVASHFTPPSATTADQQRQIKQLTAPARNRLLVELQVFYLPGLRSTALTRKDIKHNHIRIYAQQPEIWDSWSPDAVGAAMVGKLPRLSSSHGTAKPARQGEVYSWIDKQGKRPIFYMGLGMKQRQFDKDHAFPAFVEVAKQELAAHTDWSFIILHNIGRSESTFRRTTHDGRVFHLFVGETSWATWFPEMSLVLTHGGVGSMTDAIAAGVPQIILPTDYAADQTYFAKRLGKMHIGIGLPEIPYAALTSKKPVSVREIRDAFARIRSARHSYVESIKPWRRNLVHTDALSNTFELIERMCAGLIART